MKTKIFAILVPILTFLLTVPVYAISIPNPVSDRYKDLTSIVNSFKGWIRPLASIFLLIIIVYGGYEKITAGGDPEKDKRAYMIIRSGLIGFAIIILGPLLIDTLGAIFGINLLSNP